MPYVFVCHLEYFLLLISFLLHRRIFTARNTLFGTVVVMIMLTFSLNFVAVLIRSRARVKRR